MKIMFLVSLTKITRKKERKKKNANEQRKGTKTLFKVAHNKK